MKYQVQTFNVILEKWLDAGIPMPSEKDADRYVTLLIAFGFKKSRIRVEVRE